MRLEELHRRLGEILTENPAYKFRPVLYWRGKMANGIDAFGLPNEIIACTVNHIPGSTATESQNCIVLSPVVDFAEFKILF